MKRRTSTKEVRIYSYGCLPPIVGRDEVEAELRAANDFFNKLVEIERARSARYRAARAVKFPELTELEARLEQIESEICYALDSAKGKEPGAQQRVDALKAEQKDCSARAKIERANFAAVIGPAQEEQKRRAHERGAGCGPNPKSAINAEVLREMLDEDWPEEWKTIARSDAAALAAVKAARADRVCSSGTGGLVERSFQMSKETSGGDPGFRRFDGTGRIGGQITRLSVSLLEGNGVVRVTPAPPKVSRRTGQVLPPDPRFRLVHLRHGTKGKTVESVFPVKWHRELPSDARITYAWILISRQGNVLRYELQLTLESSEFPKRPGGIGGVDLWLRWSKVPDGICVAEYEPEGKPRESLVLPSGVVDRLNLRESVLREVMDERYVGVNPMKHTRPKNKADGHGGRPVGGAHQLLVRSLRLWGRHSPGLVPAWMTEAPERRGDKERKSIAETVHLWKSHESMRRLALRWSRELLSEERVRELWARWRTERKAAGLDLFAPVKTIDRWLCANGITKPDARLALYLEWWRRKDEHLNQWGADSVARARGHRRQMYRNFAIDLAGRFERIRIHDVKLDKMARKPPKGKDRPEGSVTRSQQKDAAPSELRAALLEVFGKSRVELIKPLKVERSDDGDLAGGARALKKGLKNPKEADAAPDNVRATGKVDAAE